MAKDYKSIILNKVDRPYVEFWKTIIRSASSRNVLSQKNQELLEILDQITDLIKSNKLYVKYQLYDKTTGQLLGFFDPVKIYSGISIGGRYYRQNDTINSLVLTKSSQDSIYRSSDVRQGTMVTTNVKDRPKQWELSQ